MRPNFNKKHFTKSERRFVRLLQELRIPFRAKVKVREYEVDFLIHSTAIELDGHDQDGVRNTNLIEMGLTPVHFSNQELRNNRELIKKQLSNLWH